MQIYSNKLFKNPIKIIKAFNNEEFIKAFAEIEKYRKDKYLLGYIRYEAKEIFLDNKITSKNPLLYFEVYEDFEEYTPSKHNDINIDISPCTHFSEYSLAFKKIKDEIADGNTYEVNYTCCFDVKCSCDDLTLYEFLLERQTTPYNTFIKNEYETLLSFSPELFFELKDNHIITKPMKGTIERGKTSEQDDEFKNFLYNDEKNRAENVMIVDLLRNDLGRIAKTGTVEVTKLFEIETHKTLHQMTSQIEADLKENTSLYDIFQAIFPCGSITGAPKISTMKIIDKIEKGRRNIYCGAIGFITPKDIIFSVPIRILQKENHQTNFKYRAGGAVVWDSNIQDEWEETYTKIKFLNSDFKLIETIKVENRKLLFEEEHFERLKKSAEHFGFTYKKPNIKPEKDGILRILLSKNGSYELEYKEIIETADNMITISPIKINSSNGFMYHKTTYRPWFAESYEKISNGVIYDEIFFNEKGELAEGSRSNIILDLNGKLYTPPISSGILNGIYRQKLISEGKCIEKILYLNDIFDADNVYCVNSVRGIKKVVLQEAVCLA